MQRWPFQTGGRACELIWIKIGPLRHARYGSDSENLGLSILSPLHAQEADTERTSRIGRMAPTTELAGGSAGSVRENDFSWHGNGRMFCRRRAGAITPIPAGQRGAGFRSPFELATT